MPFVFGLIYNAEKKSSQSVFETKIERMEGGARRSKSIMEEKKEGWKSGNSVRFMFYFRLWGTQCMHEHIA